MDETSKYFTTLLTNLLRLCYDNSMITIKNNNNKVLYASTTAENLAQAVEEAVALGIPLTCADLRKADLRGGNFRKGQFRWATFAYAKLQGADFTDASLQGCNLVRANLHDAILVNTYFDCGCLDYARMDLKDMGETSFDRVNLNRVQFKYGWSVV